MSRPAQHWLLKVGLLLLAWLSLALPFGAQAADRLPLPAITAHVTDQTSTLSASQKSQLEAKLSEFESRRGTQIIVVIVPTTQPEDVFSYTQRLARATAVGRADVGDGLVMVVAKNDRRMHIATARALEGAIPDMIAKRIIDQVMTPAFRQGDFAGGINAALDHLFSRIEGEALPLPAEATPSSSRGASSSVDGGTIENLLLFLFLGFPVIQAVFRGIFGRVFGVLASGVFAGGVAWFVSGALYVGVAFFIIGIIVAIFFQVFGLFSAASKGSGSRGGRWGGGSGGGWSSGGGGGGWSSGGGGSFGGGGASGGW